jgi:hypothetical protein
MGMVLTARRLTADEMDAALGSQEGLDRLLFPEDDEPVAQIDVDKAWHGIHWLLTGSADETPPTQRRAGLFHRKAAPTSAAGAEALAVLGGEPIGEDNGYGPARLLRPEQVASVAEALRPLTPEVLGHRVDLVEMEAAELYPGIWDEEDVYQEYLGPNYEVLRNFYLAAADEGAAVLLAIQ